MLCVAQNVNRITRADRDLHQHQLRAAKTVSRLGQTMQTGSRVSACLTLPRPPHRRFEPAGAVREGLGKLQSWCCAPRFVLSNANNLWMARRGSLRIVIRASAPKRREALSRDHGCRHRWLLPPERIGREFHARAPSVVASSDHRSDRHHCGPLPSDAHVDGRAVGGDVARREGRRTGCDLR
jgi:hypothetical protein